MFIGYMLPFQVLPVTYNFYREYRDSIDKLHQDIERYGKLGKRAEYWEQENKRAKQEREEIEKGLLPGKNSELVGNELQRLVKQLATEAGISFKSLVRPDYLPTGDWILVTQSMQFDANSKTVMKFLQALEKAPTRLAVVSLEVRSRRDRLTGTIKITGFSRVPPPLDEEE